MVPLLAILIPNVSDSKISTLQLWSSLEYKYFHRVRKTLFI